MLPYHAPSNLIHASDTSRAGVIGRFPPAKRLVGMDERPRHSTSISMPAPMVTNVSHRRHEYRPLPCARPTSTCSAEALAYERDFRHSPCHWHREHRRSAADGVRVCRRTTFSSVANPPHLPRHFVGCCRWFLARRPARLLGRKARQKILWRTWRILQAPSLRQVLFANTAMLQVGEGEQQRRWFRRCGTTHIVAPIVGGSMQKHNAIF